MTFRAVYYPRVDIEKVDWLKASLLFWDQICPMVPLNRNDDLKYEDIEANQALEANVIVPRLIYYREKEKISLALEQTLRREYTVQTLEDLASQNPDIDQLFRPETDSYWIYETKLTPNLYERLKTIGWLREIPENQYGSRISVSPTFYWTYMTAAATILAETDVSDTVTDDEENLRRWTGLMAGRRSHPRYKSADALLKRLEIPFPSNTQIRQKNISMTQILAHREEFREERHNFHTAISSIWYAISEMEQNEAEEYLANKRTDFQSAIKEFKATLTKQGLDIASGTMDMTEIADIGSKIVSATALTSIIGVVGIAMAVKDISITVGKAKELMENQRSMSYALLSTKRFGD